MRLMGLDVGSHTIGVAISDELGITAQGLKTIKRTSKKNDVEEIAKIVHRFQIEKVVVGLPRNMNGSLGKQAERILQWARELQKEIALPLETWDERLSTAEASKVLLEADVSRKKRKGALDKLAAVIILQGYLDRNRKSIHDPLF